jgi:hypothetical protein
MRYLTALVSAACLVVLVPFEARAQGFTAGVKGGLNVSTLDVDDPANPNGEFDSRTDFLAGIWLQCGGIDWFTLQGEVIYSRNGAKDPRPGALHGEARLRGKQSASRALRRSAGSVRDPVPGRR